jgi:hypothetical protein
LQIASQVWNDGSPVPARNCPTVLIRTEALRLLAMVESQRVWDAFCSRAGLEETTTPAEVVEAIKQIPYGRPASRTAEGVVSEWRGTCSTKHALLSQLVAERWPEFALRLVHRVYRVTPASARQAFGEAVASVVPDGGLVDIHTYAVILVSGRPTRVDVTFAGTPWDGRSDMPLACGPGLDFDATPDPWTQKEALAREYCDPEVREPFIATLAACTRLTDQSGDP